MKIQKCTLLHILIYIAAETAKSQSRKPKCSKGYHCSRNAYMLVYKQQTEEIDQTESNVEVPGKTDCEYSSVDIMDD